MAVSKLYENKLRACDWSKNGNFLIAADFKGYIHILSAKDLQPLQTFGSWFTKQPKRQSEYWIQEIKISPDSTKVAFGAHGGASKTIVINVENDKSLVKENVLKGVVVTSAITHLDWSNDSNCLLINSEAYELKFASVSTGKEMAASASKDIEWSTVNTILGFPVQGIFPGAEGNCVKGVDRSHCRGFLATGDDFSNVNLFKYPVTVPKQVKKEYIGHGSHITRVRFTFDDCYLISCGGNDKAALVWKTTFGKSDGNIQQINHEDELSEEQVEQHGPTEKVKKTKE